MKTIALVGASAEATGHPTECTEPVDGSVTKNANTDLLSITSSQVATTSTADIHFDSHAHDYTSEEGCHNMSSHDLDPNSSGTTDLLTVNGNAVYVVADDVATDPVSGGSVSVTDSGGNDVVVES